jgi:hypothetical protein
MYREPCRHAVARVVRTRRLAVQGGDMALRYVSVTDASTLAELDTALAKLRGLRRATGFAVVRGWIDAEIDVVLDLRSAAMLEAMV